jgi:hypothetical protein
MVRGEVGKRLDAAPASPVPTARTLRLCGVMTADLQPPSRLGRRVRHRRSFCLDESEDRTDINLQEGLGGNRNEEGQVRDLYESRINHKVPLMG